MLTSLDNLFKVGPGPSSSHTIGPYYAALDFLEKTKDLGLTSYKVTLYGSLAFTGVGHLTDAILLRTLGENQTEVYFDIHTPSKHPNTLKIIGYKEDLEALSLTYESIGGGTVILAGSKNRKEIDVYPFNNFTEIKEYLKLEKLSFKDLVIKFEGAEMIDRLRVIMNMMFNQIKSSILVSGYVAGRLKVKRVAKDLYYEATAAKIPEDIRTLYISAYAYAIAESNAAGDIVVTAPTCGSAGVLPSVLAYLKFSSTIVEQDRLLEGLIAAGMIGLVIKKNATISGAVGGCQAEIGSATAMAAGAISAAMGLSLDQIEYAAEVGLEHQLGLTCDPVEGYVAIPCIERNGLAALKAYDAYLFARHLAAYRHNAISLDEVIKVMKETGRDLKSAYKETSRGGLAKTFKIKD